MPFSNVPEHLQDKMERCVQEVMANQPELEKENAIAICFRSVVEKSGPIGLSMTMCDGPQGPILANMTACRIVFRMTSLTM
jgi:hypothetical protein